MKYLLIVIFAMFMSACGDKTSNGAIEKITSPNVEGRYIGEGTFVFTLKDGKITFEAHGDSKEKTTTYKVVNDKIEFAFDNPVYLKIIDEDTLSFVGAAIYKRVK